MTQDFAKKKRNEPPAPSGPPRWIWFVSGFLSGAFIAFLTALWLLVPRAEVGPDLVAKPVPGDKAPAEEMQWDFYEIFPRSVVPVAEEYSDSGAETAPEEVSWILQAGSFKDPKDADERRAELLLMGLVVSTAEVEMSGNTWHRVIVGPFDSTLERNRAQDKLAQALIQSIPMKVPKT